MNFSINLPAPSEKLLLLATDYEKLQTYLPRQIKSIKIIDKKDSETITEEILVFKTIVKNEIVQQTKHVLIDNSIHSDILLGPAKGTKIQTIYENISTGTKVSIDIDLKLSLKAIFLKPIVKKVYVSMLTGVLYKMNNIILEELDNQ
tara:strand:+ start:127 stop:567 length:441 start_codon:yes stop_codon:yes gene_type:complete